jgi:hypothetical protein
MYCEFFDEMTDRSTLRHIDSVVVLDMAYSEGGDERGL